MYIYETVLTDPLSNNFAFMFVAILLYFALLFLRYKTGARVWGVLGTGILIYTAIEFSFSLPMVITLTGMIIYSLYDTFMGK